MLNVSRVIATAPDGTEFWATPEQANALNTLTEIRHGGCAALHGYRPTTGYTESPVINIQMITGFSYHALIERKLKALEAITYEDVRKYAMQDEKLKLLTGAKRKEIFEARKEFEMNSIRKTLDGDRDDAYRQAHDRNYVALSRGIKGHFVTERNQYTGETVPVLEKGLPVLKNIMVSFLELNRTVVEEGVSKPKPNSGNPVRMSNCIKQVLNQRSVGYKVASLKEDNFEKLVVSKKEILPEDVTPDVLELLRS